MMIKNICFLFLIFVLTGSQQKEPDSTIYEGKAILGYRVYLSDINTTHIVAEVGGTSIKMGAQYIILHQLKTPINDTIAISDNKKGKLIKEGDKLYFQYSINEESRMFRIKKTEYDVSINRIRLNMFRHYFTWVKKMSIDEPALKRKFDEFKGSPYDYLILNDR